MRQPLQRSRRRAKTFSNKREEVPRGQRCGLELRSLNPGALFPIAADPLGRRLALTLKAAPRLQRAPCSTTFWLTALDYERSVGHSGDSPFDPSGNSDSSQNQLLAVRSNGQPLETSQLEQKYSYCSVRNLPL